MPRVVRQYTKDELRQAFSKLQRLSDSQVLFCIDGILHAFEPISLEHGLNLRETIGLVKVLNAFFFDSSLTKTQFHTLIGIRADDWNKPLPEVFSRFFLFQDKRYVLRSEGLALLSSVGALLRRVLQDREYYFELKYGRFTKEQREKRRLNKRFYKDLTEGEQIAILRAYWILPYRTDEQKKARKLARLELFRKYDLKNWDLINAVLRFGDVVKSARALCDPADYPQMKAKH